MRNIFPCALICIVAMAAPASFAADAKSGQFGSGKPVGKFLSVGELRACLSTKDRLAQWKVDAPQQRAALADEKDAISKRGDELAAALDTLDHGNADAVAAYNDRSQARDQSIDAFKVRADAFNARVAADKADADTYAATCENRRYLADDEAAIRKGK